MALIDLDKFVESLMWMWDSYKNNPLFKNPIFNDIKLALDKQGLVYKDGKIVKTQRRVSAEAKEDGYSESEDDRIRETLIDYFENYKTQEEIGIKTFFGISTDDIIAWLEKQGEQKSADTCDSLIIKSKEFPASEKRDFGYFSESADKVEPKFKVGDWVVTDKNNVVQIKAIEDSKYVLENTMRFSVDYVDKCWRKWTIQDAKDGDLIYVSTEEKGIQAIFHEYKNDTIFFHCYLCSDFAQGGYMPIGSVELVYPLQKTHYNSFFEKMHKAGYEWDANNKELNKIHIIDEGKAEMDHCFTKMMNGENVSSTWSEEDENCLSTIIAEFSKCAGKSVSKDEWMRCNDFLNSLRDRVYPKQEWSEEDERMLNLIIQDYEAASKSFCGYKGKLYWLKSFKKELEDKL